VPTAESVRATSARPRRRFYDPATGDAAGAGRVAFADKQVPANRINPIALALIAKMPLPNRPGLQQNYQVDSYRDKNTDSFDVKINYA